MASLQDLLARDGFKKVTPNAGMMMKAPNASRAISMPLPGGRDANLLSPSPEPRSNGEGKNRWSRSLRSSPAIGYEGTNKIPGSRRENSIACADGTRESDGSRSGAADYLQGEQRQKQRAKKASANQEEWGEKKHIKNHIPQRASSSGWHLRGPRVLPSEGSHHPPSEGSGNLHNRRQPILRDEAGMEPSLGEAATLALVSILNDYISCFFKDRDFRTSLRQKCYYCLRFTAKGSETNRDDDTGVAAKLLYAIGIIERSVEEFPDPKELKRCCAQLSAVIGLNSSVDLKGGLISGIPKSRLSACAHLYLGVVYRMQKKDRASAKHLLQVFCDSPFETRTILLPDLWERLVLPHLSQLEAWHVKEAEGVSDDTPCTQTKMKLLERVYNDALDSGTRQTAAYYKQWLMEGEETPTGFPSIHVPSAAFSINSQEGLQVVRGSQRSESNLASPRSQPLMSRKLYESIFNRSREKDASNELEGGEEGDAKQSCACRSSSSGRDVEDDEMGDHRSSQSVMDREGHVKEDLPFLCPSSLQASSCVTSCTNITRSGELMLENLVKYGNAAVDEL